LRNAPREFALDDRGMPESDDYLLALGPRFRWHGDGRARTVRRAWLDTFDWRLYRAGLTLELTSGRGTTELVLTGRDGAVVAAQQAGPAGVRPKWPGLLDVLPVGPLRERLRPVVGVRALLPVARATSTVHGLRVLNSDEKTVARVTVDRMAVSSPAKTTLPPRLTVTALRGYQAQADRLTDILAAASGMTDGGAGALAAALAAAGRHPGDYTGKISVQLDPQAPAVAAVAAVLAQLLGTLQANVGGVLRDIDTEFLHDLRIAVRRTRSTLKLAGDVLPGSLASRFRPEFKWLGDLTTPTRDLDVYLLDFGAMAAGLAAASPAELQPFHDQLARRRAAAQRQLARGLRSARFSRLTGEWRDALGSAAGGGRARPSAAQLAGRRIRRAHRRVLADGAAITATSAPESMHELRKRCKDLRYLLEIFGSLYDPSQHWQAVRELKALQNCLGEFQDTEVQRAEIRTFATQMMADRTGPAATLLAMGEVAAGLAVRQQRARGQFAGIFADFASPASQQRILAMTETATP
jgi:CHAD domain-containing protein